MKLSVGYRIDRGIVRPYDLQAVIAEGGFQVSAERMAMFPHRQNEDGTFDSICPHCFSTVVRGLNTESQLAEFEDQHVCHSDFLAERGVSFENIVVTTRSVFGILTQTPPR
jgi:hypothetical protein